MVIEVVRPKDTVVVTILKHKLENKYSFVNLTKGHICPCKFNSIKEAIEELEQNKKEGKVLSYIIKE
jgi:hypothetical protein